MHLLRNPGSPGAILVAALFLALAFVHGAAALDPDLASHTATSAPPTRSLSERLAGATEPPLTEVDVLVLYTTAARDGAGGVGPLKTAILEGFTDANQIHSNSLTGVRLNPVAIIPAPFAETGSIVDDFPAFASDQGLSLRSEYRADLVMMVYEIDKSDTAGGAGPGRPGPTGNSSAAFFAVQRTRPRGLGEGIANRSGILLGCDGSHPSKGAFPYSTRHSFVVDGFEVGTIMGRGGMAIPYFSNPDVLYRGQPTGIPGQADNAATIREIGPIVAAYQRCTNRVGFELAQTTVSEKDGFVRLQVLRHGPLDTTAQLRVSPVNGTAKSGTDFEFSYQVVSFAIGERVRSLEVRLIHSELAQGSRTFRLQLVSPGAGTGLGMNGVAEVIIEDDDVPFRLVGAEGFVAEGSQGTSVRVTRDRGLESEATVPLGSIPAEVNGSVLASMGQGSAPAPLPILVRFEPGQSEAVVRITVPEDAEARPDAAIRLGLQGSWPEGNPSTTLTLWVRDNDRTSGAIRSIVATQSEGKIEGPVLPLPDGSFLVGRRT